MAWTEPENPTSDDHVTLWVIPNTTCTITYLEVDGSHFYFTSVYSEVPQPCLSTMFPIPFKVGRLEAGGYQMTYTGIDIEPVTQSFSVTQGDLPFPEPTIPTLGIPATILLAVGLAWIAKKMFRKNEQKHTT